MPCGCELLSGGSDGVGAYPIYHKFSYCSSKYMVLVIFFLGACKVLVIFLPVWCLYGACDLLEISVV